MNFFILYPEQKILCSIQYAIYSLLKSPFYVMLAKLYMYMHACSFDFPPQKKKKWQNLRVKLKLLALKILNRHHHFFLTCEHNIHIQSHISEVEWET